MTLCRASGYRGHVGALALLLAGGALSGKALGEAQAAPPAPGAVAVTITDKGCEPNRISVPAGKSSFTIKNASRRAVEWEILKDVRVVAERENIVPGFVQSLTATLDPGEYQMTCGLLSNPKGILTVTATDAPPPKPSALDLVGPLSEYKVYVTKEVDALVEGTGRFTDAVKAGKLDEARQLYAPARQHYERIEPIAELFDDLDKAIDSREDDFEKKAADPHFTGFHRIEKSLFADNTTAGMVPFADKLMADVLELQKRIGSLTIPPKTMVGGAAELIEEVAATKISGEEDRYSRTDLWDFQANLEGAQKIVQLLDPLVSSQDPKLTARLKDNFGKVDGLLAHYKSGDGFVSFEQVSEQDRTSLKGPITTLAEDLASLRGTLAID
jgi:iron uptake system component EfeO